MHGLWHAIRFDLRSVSFMSRDNDDVAVPVVCLSRSRSRTTRSIAQRLIGTISRRNGKHLIAIAPKPSVKRLVFINSVHLYGYR